MVLKVIMLVVFFAIMLGVGFYSRKHTKDVNGFVLGGRSVGPWLTAFAYGTSYFSAVIFIGYAGQFGWKYGIASTWIGIGNALLGSLVAWVVLGRRTRLLTQELDTVGKEKATLERDKEVLSKAIGGDESVTQILLNAYSLFADGDTQSAKDAISQLDRNSLTTAQTYIYNTIIGE